MPRGRLHRPRHGHTDAGHTPLGRREGFAKQAGRQVEVVLLGTARGVRQTVLPQDLPCRFITAVRFQVPPQSTAMAVGSSVIVSFPAGSRKFRV